MQQQAVLEETHDSTLMGILLVATGITVFSAQDVIIRLLSGDYSVVQIMFIRALVALVPMAMFVYWEGGFGSLRNPRLGLQIARGLLMVSSYTAYYLGLAALPIADNTAIFFVSPLIVTVFSVIFLGEKVGLRRFLAVIAGFVGVLVIVQPGSGAFGIAATLPLMAAVTYSGSIMITRRLGRTQTGASMAFYAMIMFLITSSFAGLVLGDGGYATDSHVSVGFLLRGWQIPGLRDLLLLTLCGLIAACGFYCLSQGYRVAQASIVAPFEYIAMPIAVIWGISIWDEVPRLTTILGIALIVASGLYVLHRETIRGRRLVADRGRIRL